MKFNNKLVEKIINHLLNALIIVFGILLLVSLYTTVQTKVLGNEYTDFFGYSMFEVQTGSMSKAINPGDWIIVKLTKQVELNDVITYKQNKEFITHRLIEVYNGKYITKGDANSSKDEAIYDNQVVGKVVRTLRGFGILRKTIFNPIVLISIFVTLFLFNLAFKKNEGKESSKDTKKSLLDNLSYKILSLLKKHNKDNKKVYVTKPVITSKINNEKEELSNNVISSEVEVNEVDEEKEVVDDVTKKEKEKIKEDELEKTAMYRVISVNDYEKPLEEDKSEIDEEPYVDEEIDKTSLYRVITVDSSEVDNTLLEVAENEIKDGKPKEKIVKEELEEEETVEEGLNLDLLKENRSKKGKNIIDSAMIIKKDELESIINIIVKDNSAFISKPTIKDSFLDSFIVSRFYYYDSKKQNIASNVEKNLKANSKELLKNKKDDKDYIEVVNSYLKVFLLAAELDNAKDYISDLKVKKEFYKKELIGYFQGWDLKRVDTIVGEIVKTQKEYSSIMEMFIKNLESEAFELHTNQLLNKKNFYGVELKHNINFNKIYSDYIIDKTYTEGIVAEDKILILLTLILAKLISNMMMSDFGNKYIIYFPKSLYSKEKKYSRLLRIIDDVYAKENIYILVSFEELLKNKNVITANKKLGFKYVLIIEENNDVLIKHRGEIYLTDYIFMNKNISNKEKILKAIPEELIKKIVYEDITDKIGDFGGEI